MSQFSSICVLFSDLRTTMIFSSRADADHVFEPQCINQYGILMKSGINLATAIRHEGVQLSINVTFI